MTTPATITGIAAAVPASFVDGAHFAAVYGAEEAARIDRMAGLDRRPRLPAAQRPVDLAHAAAIDLLTHAAADPGSVDALLYLSQSPEFRLPATACILQERLGLPRTALALDVNLGCSGWVQASALAAGLVRSGVRRRVLLIAGDVMSRLCHEESRATAPLFGDAMTATLIEAGPDGAQDAFGPFVLGTDGRGWSHLLVPVGQQAYPTRASWDAADKVGLERVTHPEHLGMNGDEIFAFTLSQVPRVIQEAIVAAGLTAADIDGYCLHQASQLILDQVRRKAKVPPEKMLLSLARFGNTSSASIPITLCHALAGRPAGAYRALAVGFGVGLSWGATVVTLDPARLVPVLEVDAGHRA